MPWVQIRSRRDPAVWLPIVAVVALLVPAAIGMHVWLQGRADELVERAAADPERGLAEAIAFVRTLGWGLAGVTAALGLALLHFFQLGLREGRLPPSGWWSLGAFRVAVGDTAHRAARFGRVVAVVLIVASFGLGLAVEHLIEVVQQAAAEARTEAEAR